MERKQFTNHVEMRDRLNLVTKAKHKVYFGDRENSPVTKLPWPRNCSFPIKYVFFQVARQYR